MDQSNEHYNINNYFEWFAMYRTALLKTSIVRDGKSRNGFTLVEIMIAVGIFSLVIAGTISVFIMCQKMWHSCSLEMQTTQDGSLAMAKMVYGIGTNCGLRTAASITVNDKCGYCLSTNYPLPANSSDHGLSGGTPNRSWRITSSNEFDGKHYIDYNSLASNIVFWPDIGSPPSRELICNYICNAVVSNTSDGIFITIAVERIEGMFSSTNQLSTFIKMRNN